MIAMLADVVVMVGTRMDNIVAHLSRQLVWRRQMMSTDTVKLSNYVIDSALQQLSDTL